MPSERASRLFGDIAAACDRIKAWVHESGGSRSALAPDTLVRSAIERQLLIISEAAIRLSKLDSELCPRLAPDIDWPGVRGMGNFIRHKYDDLDTEIIAGVLGDKLEELACACRTAQAQLTSG